MLNLHAIIYGAARLTEAAKKHPLYKRALAAAGVQPPDEDGTYRHLNPNSPWNYVPESPSPSLIDVYHRQYDFNTAADVDTTNTWDELTSGANSQLARNNYSPANGNASIQAGPNADDYAFYQETFSSIYVDYTGSTVGAENSNIWFEAYVKTDDYTDCQWFIGFSQQETDASAFTVPDEGFGFYLDLSGDIGFLSASGGQTEEITAYNGSDTAAKFQFHAYIGESSTHSVDGESVFMVFEVFVNDNRRGQILVNDIFPYDTELYLTMYMKTLSNTTEPLRLFHIKQINEKPGT